jgi:hypothetical protein
MLRLSLSGAAGPARSGPQRAASIEELLEEAAEEGTHSILDITHVASQREFGAATRLPPRMLERHFGTTQPTREQVEELALDIADYLDRWEAFYFVVYRAGQPDEYAFIGCSGD